MGFLPVITTPDGTEISQTLACIMYMGDEFSLYGKGASQKGVINCAIVTMKEAHDHCADVTVFLKDETEKVRIILYFELKLRVKASCGLHQRNTKQDKVEPKVDIMNLKHFFILDVFDSENRNAFQNCIKSIRIVSRETNLGLKIKKLWLNVTNFEKF